MAEAIPAIPLPTTIAFLFFDIGYYLIHKRVKRLEVQKVKK